MQLTNDLKHTGHRSPLTSADHRNSSQAGSVKNWRKLRADLSLWRGGYGQLPELLAAFPSKDLHTTHCTISYLCSQQKWRQRSSSSCVFFFLTHSAVETSPNCAVVPRSPPSARPGASSGLQAPLFGKEIREKREERVTR